MEPYEKVKLARSSDRPTVREYINALFPNSVELHGDRCFGDESAMVGGIGYLGKTPVTFIGIDKGRTTEERIKNHFGSPGPEGYRKALRLMRQASKFRRPVITFVDTAGAYCGEVAEMRGQGQAIAQNLMEMMKLDCPVVTLVTGEGGSGGALGIAVSDSLYMLENAVYSVISPEGCAEILFKDAKRSADAAKTLCITAGDMVRFGVADGIVSEDFDNFPFMCKRISLLLSSEIERLSAKTAEELRCERYDRFRKIGVFCEN